LHSQLHSHWHHLVAAATSSNCHAQAQLEQPMGVFLY
jgi:hypothetical protein